ncbi:hypothetical protein LIX31_04560 [Leptospira kirschneri]|nr:hypothetical protein [Leptospira kirschneri]WBF96102.1 hypothetical protein LIX31_04560 [Leptospira kirschneri]
MFIKRNSKFYNRKLQYRSNGMEGKDIIILDKELIPILVGNHDGQIF